jgi:exopolysaccharide biosynthesis polyprenyl glycosylphosphotransferase
LGDLLVVSLITLVALRLGAARSGWDWSLQFALQHIGWFVVFGALWIGLAAVNGLYDQRQAPDRWVVAMLSAKVSGQILILWALLYFIPPPWTLVRHVAIFFAAGTAVVMPLWRQAYAAVFSRSEFRRRIIIVGAGWAGKTVLAAIESHAPLAIEVLGFADDDPALRNESVEGAPVVAASSDLVEAARELGATELVLAITHRVHRDLFAALMDAREQGLAITPMPLLYEEVTGRVPVEHIADQWAVALPLDPAAARGAYPLVSRTVDLAFSLVGLAILALLLLPVAPLIKLGSAGPVFYRQTRVGRGGRPFRLLKLRTMVADSEPEGPVWAEPGDPRITPVGRWLRRARIDELPQLVNVVRGEMSIVGPRPERPEFVARLADQIPFYRARHAVRPGLTGWATINQGYAGSTEQALVKLQYDLYYIKHQSVYLDAYIMIRTAAAVVRLGGV